MFHFFRRGITSWIMLGFLGLAVLALVMTDFSAGIGGGGTPATGDELARVESEAINEGEVSDLVNRQFRDAQAQQPTLDLRTFLAQGAFDSILEQLISGRALDLFAGDQGLVATQRMIDREILAIPAFRNFAGQFDEGQFRQLLQQQNVTEAQLRGDIRSSLLQRQLLLPVAANVEIPNMMARQYASLLLETRQGQIGFVPAEAMGEGNPPTDQQVAAYYRENQTRYTIPERRVIRYATLGDEQLGDAVRATEAEIATYYRDNQARYGGVETRNISHIILQDEAAARAFADRVRGGTAFVAAASEAGFAAGDVTFDNQSREAFAGVTTPAVAEAAFSAEANAIAGPVRSPLGFHVVRVNAVNAGSARPLAAVRGEIVEAIEERKRVDVLGNLINDIEDRIARGASFEELARESNLQIVETPPVVATGQAVDGAFTPGEDLQPLLRAAFELGEGNEPVVETITPNERFALMDVTRIVPAAAPPLAQIQDQVRADLLRQRAADRARAVAQSIVTKINAGTAPAAAFAEADMPLPPLEAVNRRRMDISPDGAPVPPPLAMLFSMAEGTAKILEGPNGIGWFVVHLAERTPGDASDQPDLIQATRAQFNQSASEEIAQQFARAVRSGMDISRNQDAITRVRQRLGGGSVVD